MRWLVLVTVAVASACRADDAVESAYPSSAPDAGDAAPSPPLGAGGDAGSLDAGSVATDGASDGATASTASWARYTLAPGAHAATLASGAAGNPKAGFVDGIAGRDYELAFDPSAVYTITQPAQPNDQLDWNKLPGLSDCGTLDLAADGAMFGWRWRLDTSPNVLEVTAYANDAGTHLTPPAPMITLDAADLASAAPLRYRLWMDGAVYRFTISGTMRGRAIDAATTLTRRCATTAPSSLLVQWAAGFYFGGTSTAPSTITSRIFEQPFS